MTMDASQIAPTRPSLTSRVVAAVFQPDRLLSAGLLLLLLGTWEAAARLGWLPSFLVPAPSAVARAFAADMTSPAVLTDLYVTLVEVLIGFTVAAVAGIGIGSLMALVPIFEKTLTPYVTALQTIPKVAIAPLLIIWFGFGMTSKVVIVALIAFFPVLVNTIAGLKGVDRRQLLLMRSMEASAWQTFTKVRIPAAIPFLMAGFQIALVFSIIGAIVGEFLGAAQGLGSLIVRRQGMMDVEGVFSVLLILSLMGLILDGILRMIAARLTFWADNSRDAGH
jgi:NitT/TauT family transport system permease protein